MAELTSVVFPLFSLYLFYKVVHSQVWSYLKWSVKGDEQIKEERF